MYSNKVVCIHFFIIKLSASVSSKWNKDCLASQKEVFSSQAGVSRSSVLLASATCVLGVTEELCSFLSAVPCYLFPWLPVPFFFCVDILNLLLICNQLHVLGKGTNCSGHAQASGSWPRTPLIKFSRLWACRLGFNVFLAMGCHAVVCMPWEYLC